LTRELRALQSTHAELLASHASLQATYIVLQTSHDSLTASATNAATTAKRKLRDREEELREKGRMIGRVTDEMLALEVHVNALEGRCEALKVENRELVERLVREKAGREGEL